MERREEPRERGKQGGGWWWWWYGRERQGKGRQRHQLQRTERVRWGGSQEPLLGTGQQDRAVWERRTREGQDEVREGGKRATRESGNGHTETRSPSRHPARPHRPLAPFLCPKEPW